MIRKGVIYLFTSFFFLSFFSINVQSQTTLEKEQDLITVLSTLEKRYEISFSYADESIKNIKIATPKNNLTLNEVLIILEESTNLDFKLLDNRFVTITTIKENNKASNIQKLKEVKLTSYLTSGISRSNDGTITIKSDKLGILPGLIEADVLQTIQAIPGVLSIDERVSNINVRGGTNDQNLILWDGIKMYQSGHFFGLISAFNPYVTKKINISKNGTPSKYGDGISSVINMQLSNTIDNEFKSGFGFNLINIDGYATLPLSKQIEIQVSARRSVTDFITTPTYDQYFKRIFQDSDITNNQDTNNNSISKNEQFYFYDVSAKILYDISKKDKLRVSFLNIYNNLNYEEQSTINNIDEALNSKLLQRNIAAGIEFNRDWNAKLTTKTQFYISKYNLDAINFDVLNDQRLIQENEVYDGSFKLDINYKLNKVFRINSGYQFSEVGISNLEEVNNPVFKRYIKEVIRTNSVYIESDFRSKNTNTNLKIGSRFNYINKFSKFIIEPRFSFSQRFLNYFRMEVLAEFKSQTTSQIIDLQNDYLGIEKRRWVLSNDEDIPVLMSKQVSFGIHYNKNKLLISAEAYVKEVEGITTRSQGFQNQYQYVNAIGDYRIKGVDFLINKQFNTISTWLSYSFSKNDYTFNSLNNGKQFPNNADIRHAATFAGTYTLNKLKFAIGFNWHSGKPTTTPEQNNGVTNNSINYSTPNSSNLSDYSRVDFSVTYGFNFSDTIKTTIGASIWNVLNKKNVINSYYTIDDNEIISKVENQSLGITPNVSLRVDF